jgi:RNA polymerase sigma factor (sigma-70 family)
MARSRDARLLARIRRGDDSAFERLHALYQPTILSFCVHLTGSREDAEDAVQHTFMACYRWIHDSERSLELEPWLFTVARNRCLSLLRARREGAAVERELEPSLPDGLVAEVERRQELRDLVRDMARLPEPQRAALVLSQLDALSYREIGTVLDVPAQKVKALVYQARSSLASAREAREAPCFEVREELATARGAARRRRLLRRHVGQCEGCREFEVAVMRQRHDLGLLLPVAPSVGLGQAVFDAIGRETTTAGGAGAAAAAGGVGASVGGTLAAIGLPGIAKLAVVAAVVGGGASGALAADLPARVAGAAPWRADDGVAAGERRVDPAASDGGPGDGRAPDPRSIGLGRDDRAGRDDGDEQSGDDERALAADGDEQALANDHGEDSGAPPAQSDSGGHATLPPGLAKRDDLPPGLAKRDGDLPPGLAKRGGAPQSGPGNGAGTPGNGNGNGGVPAGQGNGNAGGQGQGHGSNGGGTQSGGEGNGNAGGQGQGNGNGNGNGNAGGQGQGNGNAGVGQSGGGGQGNAGGNGNGKIK